MHHQGHNNPSKHNQPRPAIGHDKHQAYPIKVLILINALVHPDNSPSEQARAENDAIAMQRQTPTRCILKGLHPTP